MVELLRRQRFRHTNEAELQEGIAIALTRAGVSFQREVKLGPRDRIDFLVEAIGIEIKVGGSASTALRQLHRYAKYDQIKELVLVTSRIQAGRQPQTINGKPVHVVFIVRGFG